MKLTEIEKQFEPVAMIRGGVFLLSATDALRFIDQAERNCVAVEGIEGFKVFGEKIQPNQEHSLDLQGEREQNHEVAKKFIQERVNSGLWFEVVTSDRSS